MDDEREARFRRSMETMAAIGFDIGSRMLEQNMTLEDVPELKKEMLKKVKEACDLVIAEEKLHMHYT